MAERRERRERRRERREGRRNLHHQRVGSRRNLADEISPDSCRLWDTNTGEKLDKDRFRRDLGNVIESYTEVARRLGIMKDMPTVIQGGLH